MASEAAVRAESQIPQCARIGSEHEVAADKIDAEFLPLTAERAALADRVAGLERDAERGKWFLKHAYLAFDEDIPAWVLRLDSAIVPEDRVYESNEQRVDAAIDAALRSET